MTDKNIDQATGRVKQAAGALTGDRRLKREGHVDQAKGSLKKAVDQVAETIKGEKHDRASSTWRHAGFGGQPARVGHPDNLLMRVARWLRQP